MRRFLLAILLVLLLASRLFAAGASTTASVVYVPIDDKMQRVVVVLSCTADDATAAFNSYTLNPATIAPSAGPNGIKGWYLYKIETDPGATGPTNAAWDFDATDANGYVVTRNLADDRSSTATQEVIMSSGYPMILGNWTLSLADNAVNEATVTIYLTFVSN